MIAKAATILALVLLPLVALAGCASGERAGASGDGGRTTAGQAAPSTTAETTGKSAEAEARAGSSAVARAGGAEARAGDDGAIARAGNAEARTGGLKGLQSSGDQGSARKATLKLEGDPGTQFSGSCTVGNEEQNLDGRVPKSFDFDLNGGKLECEIHKQGSGELRVIFETGNSISAQSVSGSESTVKLVHGDGISVSQSSSGFSE